jgi:heptosyltransferase-2/heptosyltransferase-3
MPLRIALILPCCIGDVVLATATLRALRRAYPDAHISWLVGSWSKGVLTHHPDVNALIDVGAQALPVKSWGGFWRFVRVLRHGQYDIAVSLVRSPLMSVAVLLSGIPLRAGVDSGGRGFGYSHKAHINPQEPRHEAEIYLSVVQAMGINTHDCYAYVPLLDDDISSIKKRLAEKGISAPYIVINPNGGQNPGMTMDSKRYPPHLLGALADRLAQYYGAQLVIVGGPSDQATVDSLVSHLKSPSQAFVGSLRFGEIGALAHGALFYIGNDTGMTHLASASGGKTVMILGPSDPVRYAPYTPNSLAVWKPTAVPLGGVAQRQEREWEWERDGIGVDEAFAQIVAFINR